jgi:hypothetical protein
MASESKKQPDLLFRKKHYLISKEEKQEAIENLIEKHFHI